MSNFRTVRQDPNFDWENVDVCGMFPRNIPMPTPAEARVPKEAIELNVANGPDEFLETYYIDGFEVKANNISFRMRSRSFAVPGWKLDGVCLNVKLDSETWQFVALENHFNSAEISKLSDWITNENQRLLNIGTEFEQHERQIYHFLYEILSIFHAFKNISEEKQKEILDDTQTATSLYHNRILAEVLSGYSKKGAFVEAYPLNNNRKPDLKISSILVEIKTLLITGNDRRELMREFARKLREEIIEREEEKQQVGEKGSFFIGAWSGIVNSIMYTAYHDGIISGYQKSNAEFYDTLPPLNEKKAILIIPTHDSFQNNYLVFDRDKICDVVDYLAGEGYDKIQEGKSMKYLVLNNVRKGCEFGVTGEQPKLLFKFR
ncbi:MAG: hypothetical protein YK1309IOTA_840005 [Marine Group I thaumarchaeote]|nr:MAG: hypothetical protein YK1309IOTA_840005 [Marine Group I thaumarchaeote]